tara:strand:- start:4955 stop:5332 length:378 start_codon:yes stop_codon:yes gene_type:complete
MRIIKTKNAPKAIGPYSQGINHNNFVYTSGQIPINPETGKLVEGNFKLEVEQVLNNVDAVLKEGGSSLNHAIKLTVFVTDLNKFSELNEVFENFFDENPPARSAVEVSALPMGVRVEIEAVGYVY